MIMNKIVICAAALSAALFLAHSIVSAQGVTVFEEKMSGYAGFRIPAVVKAADGSVLAFAEARRNGKGDAGDIDLVMRRSADDGKTWSEMQTVWDDGGNTCGNPAPVVLGDGTIVMLMTWNRGNDHERDIENYRSADTRRVFVTRSADNGHTWSVPEEITGSVKRPDWGWYATGPCHAIVKTRNPHRGRIIVPSNHSEAGADGKPVSRSQIIYSDDGGRIWTLGAVTEVRGNESTVAELKDGSLLLNMRRSTPSDSVRFYAVSRDGGESFSEQGRMQDLVEPRCQGSMLGLMTRSGKSSRTLLFSNPRSLKRENLCLTRSDDNGRTWKELEQIYRANAAYSDIVMLSPGCAGVLYENGEVGNTYKRISFVTVDIDDKSVR